VFPAPRGGHLDLHNFRNRDWKPAQRALGIDPIRRVYDLRHTSTFDLSRYMGASLTMIDRHYGHLAKDGRQHAIDLLDKSANVHAVDARWTPKNGSSVHRAPENHP
jgi:integrase